VNVGTGIKNRYPEQFVYTNVELLDLPEQDITPGRRNIPQTSQISRRFPLNFTTDYTVVVPRRLFIPALQ
jgi:hypothetical protein